MVSHGADREGSTPEWTTDEEFGRQVLAGQNACVLQLVDKLPADCHIKDADLQGTERLSGQQYTNVLGAWLFVHFMLVVAQEASWLCFAFVAYYMLPATHLR